MSSRRFRDSPPDPPGDHPRASVELRFHGSLNDFLPDTLRDATLRRRIAGQPAVKDVLEAAGVPHPEIALVLVNGAPVDLGHRLAPDDRVAAYPAGWRGPAFPPVSDAPSPPAGEARFVLDGHLGRLAAYLRMCGFDTAYRHDAGDDELARIAASDQRILLTRDVGLLKRSVIRRGAYVRGDRPPDQLVEVLGRFDLVGLVRPFARCLRCNGSLEPADRESVQLEVPPRVYREQESFRRCAACGGIYWRGSHHARMTRLLAHALAAASGPERVQPGEPAVPPGETRPGAPPAPPGETETGRSGSAGTLTNGSGASGGSGPPSPHCGRRA